MSIKVFSAYTSGGDLRLFELQRWVNGPTYICYSYSKWPRNVEDIDEIMLLRYLRNQLESLDVSSYVSWGGERSFMPCCHMLS